MSLSARGPSVSLFALLLNKLDGCKNQSDLASAEYFACARCRGNLAPRSLRDDFRSPRPTEGASMFDKAEPSLVSVSNPLGVVVSLVTLQPGNCVHLERSGAFENSWFQGYLSSRVNCPKCHETIGWALARGNKPISKRTPRNAMVNRFVPDPAKRPIVFTCGETEEMLQPKVPLAPHRKIVSRRRAFSARPQGLSKADDGSRFAESVTLGEIQARAQELEKTAAHLERSQEQIQASENTDTQASEKAKVQISDAAEAGSLEHGSSDDKCDDNRTCSGFQSVRDSHGSGSIGLCMKARQEAMVAATTTCDSSVIPLENWNLSKRKAVTDPTSAPGSKSQAHGDHSQGQGCSLGEAHDVPESKVHEADVCASSAIVIQHHADMKAPESTMDVSSPFEVKVPEAPKPPQRPNLKTAVRYCNPSQESSRPLVQASAGLGSTLKRRAAGASMSWLPSGCLSGSTTTVMNSAR